MHSFHSWPHSVPSVILCYFVLFCVAEELATQLGELGVSMQQPHPVFGQVEAQIKTFCARRQAAVK